MFTEDSGLVLTGISILSGSFFGLDDCLHIQNSGLEDFSLRAMKVQTLNEELGARSLKFLYSIVFLYLIKKRILAHHTVERLF